MTGPRAVRATQDQRLIEVLGDVAGAKLALNAGDPRLAARRLHDAIEAAVQLRTELGDEAARTVHDDDTRRIPR